MTRARSPAFLALALAAALALLALLALLAPAFTAPRSVARSSFAGRAPLPPRPRPLSRAAEGAGGVDIEATEFEGGGKAVLSLLGGAAFFFGLYLLFFKATSYITTLVSGSPELEVASFVALSLIPLLLVQRGAVDLGVVKPLTTLANAMPTPGLKHIVASAIPGCRNIMIGVLLFFTFNLLASAAPEKAQLVLPEKFKALDPDGNGILTAQEFEGQVRLFTVKLLQVLAYFETGLFGLTAIQKPKAHVADGTDIIDRYWKQLDYRKPKAVVLYLALNAAIMFSTMSGVLQAWGLAPRSVLAVGGVGGLAFGLASQNLVGNFMSGILLIVNRQFSVGDFIATNGVKGKVRSMGWTFIEIESGDDLVMLPNSMVVNAMVTQIDRYAKS